MYAAVRIDDTNNSPLFGYPVSADSSQADPILHRIVRPWGCSAFDHNHGFPSSFDSDLCRVPSTNHSSFHRISASAIEPVKRVSERLLPPKRDVGAAQERRPGRPHHMRGSAPHHPHPATARRNTRRLSIFHRSHGHCFWCIFHCRTTLSIRRRLIPKTSALPSKFHRESTFRGLRNLTRACPGRSSEPTHVYRVYHSLCHDLPKPPRQPSDNRPDHRLLP